MSHFWPQIVMVVMLTVEFGACWFRLCLMDKPEAKPVENAFVSGLRITAIALVLWWGEFWK